MDGASASDISSVPAVVEALASVPQTNSVMPDTSSADMTGCVPEAAAVAQIPASVDGAAASGDAPSDAPPAEVQKDPLLEAFEAQRAAVQADPGDFNKLVGLISAADKLVRNCR